MTIISASSPPSPHSPDVGTTGDATVVPTRYRFIDALRGCAALWVVLFHIKSGRHIDELALSLPRWLDVFVFDWGHLGVPIFFVLSGFVIAHCFHHADVTLGYVGRFALRRSVRLDPPYWASMLILCVYGYLSARVQNEAYALPSAASLAAHAFYLQGILGFEPLSTIYWTLCQEFQFYLVFAALLWLSQSASARSIGGYGTVFLAAAIVSLLWPAGILSTERWYVWWLPFWHGFLLGAFAYWAWQRRISAALFWVYAAVLGAIGVVQGSDFTNMCVVTSAVILVVANRGHLADWLSWRPLQWLGMISYSLYLTHTPVSGVVGYIVRRFAGPGVPFECVSLVAQTLGALLLATTLYFWVERPCMAWSRRIKLQASRTRAAASMGSDTQNDKDFVTVDNYVPQLQASESY